MSFPEAEVTKSLFKGLVIKQAYTNVDTEDKRVINTNELMKKRMAALEAQMRQSGTEGFQAGLDAKTVGNLLADGEEGAASGNVVKASTESAEEILQQAKNEAASILEKAQAESVAILEQAQAQAEQEKGKVFEEAKKQGYAAGKRDADAQAKVLAEEFEEKKRNIQNVYEEKMDKMEPQLVDTITDIYEHIFHVELSNYKDILGYLISSTLRKIEGGHEFIVHVSKEDYPYVSMQKKQIMTGTVSGNCNVDIIEDMTLAKNECMIETDNGIFDCGLGTELSELKQKLVLLSWSKEE